MPGMWFFSYKSYFSSFKDTKEKSSINTSINLSLQEEKTENISVSDL
jgi:hypothetical protein